MRQLDAHNQGLDATDDQKDKRGCQVTMPDLLVVYSGEPAMDRLRCLPYSLEPLLHSGRAHCLLSPH